MKTIAAFFKLIRWPNLLFIVLTQALFYYAVSIPVFKSYNVTPYLEEFQLFLIIMASVLIAAAGYIINDYFDLNIDKINKPKKLVVERMIKRRTAILWHLFLSTIGILLSIYICFSLNLFYNKIFDFIIALINIVCVIVLWIYSTTYKRKLLIGNILISLLTAWVIFILYFAEFPHWFKATGEFKANYNLALIKLFKLTVLYAAFSFIISLIREVIKDMEDMEGDSKYGCKTMPIVWGIPATKVFVAVWIVVLIAVLTILQVYVTQFAWWLSIAYCLVFIIAPLFYVLNKLFKAQGSNDYHQLSTWIKIIMFTGILSMIFFSVYA